MSPLDGELNVAPDWTRTEVLGPHEFGPDKGFLCRRCGTCWYPSMPDDEGCSQNPTAPPRTEVVVVSKADLRVVLDTEHPRPGHVDFYEALDRLKAAAS